MHFSKPLFILAMIFSIMACQNQSSKQLNTESTFSNYVDQLPKINLPYAFKCDEPFIRPGEINYEDSLVIKFKPKSAGIIGKVYENDQSIGILYTFAADVLLPVLIITDTTGVNLGGIELYELGNCTSGDNFYGEYSSIIKGQITKDLKIITSLKVVSCDSVKCDSTYKYMTKKISPSGKVQAEDGISPSKY
jgi:hypothetical protein